MSVFPSCSCYNTEGKKSTSRSGQVWSLTETPGGPPVLRGPGVSQSVFCFRYNHTSLLQCFSKCVPKSLNESADVSLWYKKGFRGQSLLRNGAMYGTAPPDQTLRAFTTLRFLETVHSRVWHTAPFRSLGICVLQNIGWETGFIWTLHLRYQDTRLWSPNVKDKNHNVYRKLSRKWAEALTEDSEFQPPTPGCLVPGWYCLLPSLLPAHPQKGQLRSLATKLMKINM